MNRAQRERINVAGLPASSVVAVLHDQPADIRELRDQTRLARGDARRQAFDKLRKLLAVHKAGAEIVERPDVHRVARPGTRRVRPHRGLMRYQRE